MIRAFLLVLFASLSAFSAPQFSTGWQDTNTYVNFRADSLKLGAVVNLNGGYCNTLIIEANDTSTAGYAADSIKFKFGYRLGYSVINASGKLDTSWGYKVTVGQISTIPADTAGKWISHAIFTTTDSTTGQEIPLIGMMDTMLVAGFLTTEAAFTSFPKTAQYVQPWVMGLAGNKLGSFVKVRSQIMQAQWVPVRGQ